MSTRVRTVLTPSGRGSSFRAPNLAVSNAVAQRLSLRVGTWKFAHRNYLGRCGRPALIRFTGANPNSGQATRMPSDGAPDTGAMTDGLTPLPAASQRTSGVLELAVTGALKRREVRSFMEKTFRISIIYTTKQVPSTRGPVFACCLAPAFAGRAAFSVVGESVDAAARGPTRTVAKDRPPGPHGPACWSTGTTT